MSTFIQMLVNGQSLENTQERLQRALQQFLLLGNWSSLFIFERAKTFYVWLQRGKGRWEQRQMFQVLCSPHFFPAWGQQRVNAILWDLAEYMSKWCKRQSSIRACVSCEVGYLGEHQQSTQDLHEVSMDAYVRVPCMIFCDLLLSLVYPSYF